METPELLTGKLRSAWNRQLYHGWEQANMTYLSGVLQRPLFQLGRGVQELGHWYGDRRLLTISETHIWRDPWGGDGDPAARDGHSVRAGSPPDTR